MISNTKLLTLIILKYDHFTSLAKEYFLIVFKGNLLVMTSFSHQECELYENANQNNGLGLFNCHF